MGITQACILTLEVSLESELFVFRSGRKEFSLSRDFVDGE